jgi:Thioesterase domain
MPGGDSRQLATRQDETQPSRLVRLKRGSGPDSLILVPGVGGTVLSLVWLARAYPGPETVAALEPASLETAGSAIKSIAGLASSHLSATNTLGGDGRRHLVGYCFGATVVMEMARQLELSGEPVSTVSLLEPFLRLRGGLEPDERRNAEARLDAAERLRRSLQQQRTGEADDPDMRHDLGLLDLDEAILQLGGRFALDLLGYATFALHAYLEHSPLPITAPVHILVGAGGVAAVSGMERRLLQLTGGVTVHELPYPPGAVLRRQHTQTVAIEIASLVAGQAAGR